MRKWNYRLLLLQLPLSAQYCLLCTLVELSTVGSELQIAPASHQTQAKGSPQIGTLINGALNPLQLPYFINCSKKKMVCVITKTQIKHNLPLLTLLLNRLNKQIKHFADTYNPTRSLLDRDLVSRFDCFSLGPRMLTLNFAAEFGILNFFMLNI